MENPVSRHNPSNIIAACILSIGLVTAACIVAQRPAPVPTVNAALPARAVAVPSAPISQESVRRQIRKQVMAATNLQALSYNGGVYHLSDVAVKEIYYSAKDDKFTAVLRLIWQPEAPKSVRQSSSITLNNNGYNEYLGGIIVRFDDGQPIEEVDVSVK